MEIYLSFAAILISLFSLVISAANFWRSRKTALVSIYPKVTGKLILKWNNCLPVYEITNESDKLIAINLQLAVSIKERSWLSPLNEEHLFYNLRLARLDPLEKLPPSPSNLISSWLDDRGYNNKSSINESARKQVFLSNLSTKKDYNIMLKITYTSNMYNENKVCQFYKKYKLLSCDVGKSTDPQKIHCWRLVE